MFKLQEEKSHSEVAATAVDEVADLDAALTSYCQQEAAAYAPSANPLLARRVTASPLFKRENTKLLLKVNRLR